MAEMQTRDENYPVPYEQTTIWKNSDIMWIYYRNNNNKMPSKEDLAVNMASSGYYKWVTYIASLNCGEAMASEDHWV